MLNLVKYTNLNIINKKMCNTSLTNLQRRKTDGAKVLDKINCVVYNIGNHEIDCVHSDTQTKPPKVAAFGGFSSGLSVLFLSAKPLGN